MFLLLLQPSTLAQVTKYVTVNGNFSLNSGGLDMSGSGNNKLFLRGASNTYAAGTFTPGISGQLVTYDGDLAQTIMPLTYRNLTIGKLILARLLHVPKHRAE